MQHIDRGMQIEQGMESQNAYYHTTYLNSNITRQRVHNRFGGMRDLANFCGDIRDGS